MNPVKQWTALAALALLPTLAHAAEGKFDRTLPVSGPVTLKVSTGSGWVHVTPGSDGRVHIVGHVHAGNIWGIRRGGSPEERVKQVVDNPPIEQSGDSITVGGHSHLLNNIAIDYEITTPKATNLEASTGSGDLKLYGLNGALKATTGSGSIETTGMTQRVSLGTGSGDINAEVFGSADVRAETGSGSIRLNGVRGGLNAETGSGNITVSGVPAENWKLETGSGSATLNTGASRMTLDAQTGSGSIYSDPPISSHGSLGGHHIKGDINGGGPAVTIETGSGDIRIH